jgi:hypothetical protein
MKLKVEAPAKRGRGRPATTDWPSHRQQIEDLLPVSFKALVKSGKAAVVPIQFRANLCTLAKARDFQYVTVSINAKQMLVIKKG